MSHLQSGSNSFKLPDNSTGAGGALAAVVEDDRSFQPARVPFWF
jgi:hypothetical protein